ncbi:hypothetical protein RhiJN_23531 [Ceratobasidium sp. AG-Ba]|nr:hypothetical protein RhiJN_23531 [Ceratobasidium sp. AG-Ba]
MLNSTEKFLAIQELVSIACRFARPQDASRFGRTSSRLFGIAMAAAWENVDSVINIFKLVEGCSTSASISENHLHMTYINLPEDFSRKYLKRLEVYALFVKNLEIFGSDIRSYEMNGAPALLEYTQKNELLPNLRRLTMKKNERFQIASHFWLKVFHSRSLLEICPSVYVPGRLPLLPLPVAAAWINCMTKKCPALETLGIFVTPVEDDPTSFDHTLEQLAIETTGESFADAILKAKTLTTLIGGPTLLRHDIFTALRQLPALNRLEIYYSEFQDDYEHLSTAPVDSNFFPSLDHLTLLNPPLNGILSLWNTRRFVLQLTSLEITFGYDRLVFTDSWIQNEFVPLLSPGCPQLTRFTASFLIDRNLMTADPPAYRLTRGNLVALSALPLIELIFPKFYFDLVGAAELLAKAWPTMTLLKLPDQPIRLEELQHFSTHMPNLSHLDIDIQAAPVSQDIDWEQVARYTRHALRVLASDFCGLYGLDPEQARLLYRYELLNLLFRGS